MEENKILSKLEEWSDKLPSKKLTITIEMENKNLHLEKVKSQSRTIGFAMEQKGGE